MAAVATLTMNPSLDVNADVDRVVPDEKLRCGPPSTEAGGGGLNVARVASRLGVESRAVLAAGGGPGQMLLELLEQEDLTHRAVRIAGDTRMNPTFSEVRSDDQYRFVLPGPELSEDEWRGCIASVAGLEPAPAIVVASGSLPPGVPADLYARLAAAVPEGTKVAVDASGEALREAAGTGIFLLKPNAEELRELCGGDIGEDGFEAAADALVEEGAAEVIVLSLGAAGAYVVQRGSRGVSLRSPTVPIASRIGAGDSMVAGIVTGLVRGHDIIDAVRLGLAAGAAAVMTPGTELAQAEDVEHLYGRVERPS